LDVSCQVSGHFGARRQGLPWESKTQIQITK
jgi:hypothetical protein